MQEYLTDKTIAVSVKAGKITAGLLAKALKIVLAEQKKTWKQVYGQTPHRGRQTVKQLSKQNAGMQNIEITDQNIKAFTPIARKYGIDFALKKDPSESPPKWMVFFKARDTDAMTAAFKEFTAKQVKRDSRTRPSLLGELKQAKEQAAKLVTDKVRNKDRSVER